jgi:hypothetical protein
MTSAQPWPPPPDLASIAELVRAADPEGYLAQGDPADEYEPEEQAIFAAIAGWPTARLTAENILPEIERVWLENFDHRVLPSPTRPALVSLAEQIERFFGPAARPLTRGASF